MKENRLRFLKDSWRPGHPNIRAELDVYIYLNNKKVDYIATAIGGGDVCSGAVQRTLTQDYLNDTDGSPLERHHCRLVVAEIGRPLDTYFNSVELMHVVFDCAVGMPCCLSRDAKDIINDSARSFRSMGGGRAPL